MAIVFAAVLVLAGATNSLFAQTPDVIHYRGHLDVPGVVPAGTVQRDLTFNLYETDIGGAPIWTEIQTLDIYDGNYAVALGVINPVTAAVFSDENRYLGVTVAGGSELTPRQRIAAVPYAMQADSLDGGIVDSQVVIPGYPYHYVNVNGSLVARDASVFQDTLRVGFDEPHFQAPETMHVTTFETEEQPSERKRFLVSTRRQYTSGGTTTWTHLEVDKNGDVKIRQNLTVQTSLNVLGPIYQRGGILHPDYVFEDDYEINTIEEHAEKMWEKKHLPAVPPREYDEEGREMVEIGKQRCGILEELEIAHIYIERLNQQVKELREEITGLKKELRERD